MLYPIAYNSDGEVVAWIEHTTTIKKDSFRNVKSDKFTEVVIPDFVEVIDKDAFWWRHIQKLTLNNGLKRIEHSAFNHNEIEKLELPNTLEYIGKEAFLKNCIEKLIIPNSVKYIGDDAIHNFSLEELVLGESVKHIGDKAFAQHRLVELVIPDSVEYIGFQAFTDTIYDNKIQTVKIGKGLKCLNRYWYSCKATNLTFSNNIRYINNEDKPNEHIEKYEWFNHIKVLNLVDIDFKYFAFFTQNLKPNFPNLVKINIKFKRNLSPIQKLVLDKYKNTEYSNILINTDYEEELNKKEVTEDKEINDLVNEIKKVLSDYKSNIADEIKEIINNLIDGYKDSIANSKPKLDLKKKKETELSFDSKNVKITRLELIKSLQDILLILNEKKDLFIYLNKLDDYLNNTIDDEIANRIKDIYNIGDILEDNTLVNKINNIVNKTRKDIKNNILGAIKSGINVEYKNNLEIEINSLYEEYQELLDTVKPYMDLLNILENNSDEARISKDILDLELVISTLDKNSKEKFSKLLEDIKTYFINILKENINKIKNHEEYVSLIDMESLVRKRLDTILQKLANTNYMTILFDDLVNHVNDGIEYLGGNELSNNSSITSIIEDIYKAIGNFSESEKEMIITEIQVILKKFKKMLNNKNKYNKLINKYKEEHQNMILPNNISILELIILNELVNILINVQEYKNDLEEYNSLSRRSIDRL